MTQPSRTTESINRDNAAIRDIMLSVKELTVPDRATLAVGIIGHLATMMNRSQMAKLLAELEEEALRVQDVPPARQRDQDQRYAAAAERAESGRDSREAAGRADTGRDSQEASGRTEAGRDAREAAGHADDSARTAAPRDDASTRQTAGPGVVGGEAARGPVGQAGRGEFRGGRLV